MSPESFIAVAIGIGLAAATGLRVFLPLLVACVAARWGALPLSAGFQWLSTTDALVALATASTLEVAAYYIPGLDHLMDVVATPAVFAAGTIVSASVMVNIPPAIMWPLAIIAGGGVAGATKVTSALVRAKTGVLTAGLANPVVSTGETAGAIVVAMAAIAIPVVCVLALAVVLVWIGRWWRRGFISRKI
jgi:hypothetical protein